MQSCLTVALVPRHRSSGSPASRLCRSDGSVEDQALAPMGGSRSRGSSSSDLGPVRSSSPDAHASSLSSAHWREEADCCCTCPRHIRGRIVSSQRTLCAGVDATLLNYNSGEEAYLVAVEARAVWCCRACNVPVKGIQDAGSPSLSNKRRPLTSDMDVSVLEMQ